MDDWDFEGPVSFLSPEEGGLERLPLMGYFPSFRYPGFDDGTQFIARPVAAFRASGLPYDDFEPLDSYVVFRFLFLDRERYKTLHHARLTPSRRFELMEGWLTVARGYVQWRRDEAPAEQMQIERLLINLGDAVPHTEAKEVMSFLYHAEWECAVNLLWATVSLSAQPLPNALYDCLVDLAHSVGMDLNRISRDFPVESTP